MLKYVLFMQSNCTRGLNLPEGPPNVETHRVEPEECRQEKEMHRNG